MRDEVRWWLAASESDLAAARTLLDAGSYHHAAFLCQQAAEKALKALLLGRLGAFPKTHASVDLLERWKAEGGAVPAGLETAARDLDRDYIDSRYPNGVGGEPAKFYDRTIAEARIRYAESISSHARAELQRP